MKRVLIILSVILFFSCSKSPEDKANVLIKEYISKYLYIPDSYDPVETTIDSAFSPNDDPVIYDAIMDAYELAEELEKINQEIESAKSSMALWSDAYSEYSRHNYNKAKQEYEEYSQMKEKLEEKYDLMEKNNEELGEKLEKQGKKFIGFKAIHTYRAKNRKGDIVFGKHYFLFDEDMKNIIATYDMDSDDYKIYEQALSQ